MSDREPTKLTRGILGSGQGHAMSDREPRYRNTQVLEGNAGADYTQPAYARYATRVKPDAGPYDPVNRDDPEHTIIIRDRVLLTGDCLNPIVDNL